MSDFLAHLVARSVGPARNEGPAEPILPRPAAFFEPPSASAEGFAPPEQAGEGSVPPPGEPLASRPLSPPPSEERAEALARDPRSGSTPSPAPLPSDTSEVEPSPTTPGGPAPSPPAPRRLDPVTRRTASTARTPPSEVSDPADEDGAEPTRSLQRPERSGAPELEPHHSPDAVPAVPARDRPSHHEAEPRVASGEEAGDRRADGTHQGAGHEAPSLPALLRRMVLEQARRDDAREPREQVERAERVEHVAEPIRRQPRTDPESPTLAGAPDRGGAQSAPTPPVLAPLAAFPEFPGGAGDQAEPRQIRVTIGRVEVRGASADGASGQSTRARPRPTVTGLDEYLAEPANGGG